jgi:hypothetical protein
MSVLQLIAGILMISGAVFMAATQSQFSGALYRHYNRPEPEWHPRWLFRRAFWPTKRQASILAWLLTGIVLAVGVGFFVSALL